jgi:superfamily I DNA/RNA helicase
MQNNEKIPDIYYQRILENIKDKEINFRGDWFEVFNNVSKTKREYMRALLDNGENVLMEPRIKVSTVHGAKGGEAHNVILYLNQTANTIKGAKKSQAKQEEEYRVWYVGITRTIENLYLIKSKNKKKEFKV